MQLRELGICRTYDDIHALLRSRVQELGCSLETLDAVSGMCSRYFSKIVGPKQTKRFGPISFDPIFTTLGLVMVIYVDEEQSARLQHRLPPMAESDQKRVAANAATRAAKDAAKCAERDTPSP